MKVILIVILLVMFSPSGISCSCIITKSLKERFEAPSVIAVLEVDSSVYIESNGQSNFIQYTLKTMESIKGNSPEFYTTEVRVPTNTCTRKLEQDERVLIIKYDSSSKINASSCSPYVNLKYFEQYNPNWRWLAKNADKDQEFFDSINSEKSIIVEKLLKEPVFVDLASTFDDYLISKLERIAYADTRNIRHNERVMVGNIVQEIIESYYYQDNLVYLRGEQIVRSFLMNRFVIKVNG
ncbi:hypothetical protein [Pleionea mediterranea]|uniref:Uncharacterized protein n=1 Tax=Pleionea mediterranea TaxID=523701 RepID=A0A316FFZ7_9GAMM|nr:hypothetical protein [Pleionea mediterranea]PWK47851.1 hypothetical protein C8D97_11065 [Pleionea mediterranea]